jgi:predicted metal-dependent HD superfamily phosphohydrolase
VLSRIDELGGSDACRLAAWFHDAVYDPNATDNEARSARLAEEVLRGLRVPDVLVAEVARLVELTATHDPDPGDHDGAVLCDADLAVLASGPEEYGRYVEGVRREYQHLDDALFARGRGDVLRRLLARDPLFSTELGRVEWEARARANVERELRSLAP